MDKQGKDVKQTTARGPIPIPEMDFQDHLAHPPSMKKPMGDVSTSHQAVSLGVDERQDVPPTVQEVATSRDAIDIEKGRTKGVEGVVAQPRAFQRLATKVDRKLPLANDGGIYLYMTACGVVGRMNATPHHVTREMSLALKGKHNFMAALTKLLLVVPCLLFLIIFPYMIPLPNHEKGLDKNWAHVSLIVPITHLFIYSSIPKLLMTVTGCTMKFMEQALVAVWGSFMATAIVFMYSTAASYPVPFMPLTVTIPVSWVVFLFCYLVIRPQFQDDQMPKRFWSALHIHNLFYVGGTFIVLYTMSFRRVGVVAQRFMAVFIPTIRFVVRKGLEFLIIPITVDFMPSSLLLAEFSIQTLVASMLPGLSDFGTVAMVVFFDLLSNFMHAFSATPTFLRMKFRIIQTLGGKADNPRLSRGACTPLMRASTPTNIPIGSAQEDPEDKFRRQVYNSSVLMALEISDILAPLVYMMVASIIYNVGDNNKNFGMGDNLSPLTAMSLAEGWKWSGLLSALELATALIVGGALFMYTGVNVLNMVKLIVVDQLDFLARMAFPKYVFILSLTLMHSGVVPYMNVNQHQ